MRLFLISLILLFLAGCSQATNDYKWIDWKVVGEDEITGTVGNVDVTFVGNFNINSTAEDTAKNYFAKIPETFQHDTVPQGPQTGDVIMTAGGEAAGRQVFTFSEPVTDPVIAILSLGSPTEPTRLVFESNVEILTAGGGYWGDAPTGEGLRVLSDGYTVAGSEAYGLIRVNGIHSEIGFTTPDFESDFGYQLAVK